MTKIIAVVGARPNFVKMAALLEAVSLRAPTLDVRLVHTGQHYTDSMSASFFADLAMRPADVNLGVGSGSHADQTARVMQAFEPILLAERPALIVVVGDVNSTLACALTAAKLEIPVAHVEAGLRSFDRRMPEEINRILTDAVSDLCFTSCAEADVNLAREGIPATKVFLVGNVMIDTLLKHRARARRPTFLAATHVLERRYALVTLHRPGNVDSPSEARRFVAALTAVQRRLPVIFPMHPRTMTMFERHGLATQLRTMSELLVVDPQPYLDFLYLLEHACVVLTDSGGIQEETTALGVPCLTLRDNTERPVTVTEGTNRLVGFDLALIDDSLDLILAGAWPRHTGPALWDGRAADRVVDIVVSALRQTA